MKHLFRKIKYIITNKFNLPKPVVDAVARQIEEHQSADFSVTELLKGATEIALTKLHGDELVTDVSENLNTLFGSAVHSILAQSAGQGSEVYMQTEVAGYTVSGTADLIEDDCITDYKTCASWKIIYRDYDDWIRQLRGYSYLNYRNTGKLIKRGRIIAFIKDWSPTQAERDKSYPQTAVAVIEFTFTDDDVLAVDHEWEIKITEAVRIMDSDDIPPCSEKDRWHDDDTWALMKEGNKKAIKVFSSEAEAKSACTEKKHYVEHRVGKDKKCDNYCIIGKCGFCPYYNENHKEEENETSES